MSTRIMFNVPNLLSMYRIACVPVIMLLSFFDGPVATWVNVFIFFWACISDLLDGIIARKTGQITVLGRFLDATSDKILVGGVLLILICFDKITGVWMIPALIIFVREIFISGLREFLGLYKISVPVSWMGKWKATVQMAASGFLMAGEYGESVVPHSIFIGKILLLAATVLTALSAWDYMKKGYETIRSLEEKGDAGESTPA